MIDFTLPDVIYLMPGSTSMRQPLSYLATLIQSSTAFHPHQSAAYLFCNDSRYILRILYWEGNSFMELRYHVEKGRFQWPGGDLKFREISLWQLERLLQGDALLPPIKAPQLKLN